MTASERPLWRYARGWFGSSTSVLGVAVLLAAATGCSDSSSGGGGSGATAAAGGGNGGVVGSGGAGGSGGAAGSGGVGEGGGTGGVGSLPTSGPCADGLCAEGYFCDYGLDSCGVYDAVLCDPDLGYCRLAATSCDVAGPVCGCDGHLHASECEAQSAGADIDVRGCDPGLTPQGAFPCGETYCDPTNEYCLYGEGDTCDDHYDCHLLDPRCNDGSGDGCGTCLAPDDCQLDHPCVCTETAGNGVVGLTVHAFYP